MTTASDTTSDTASDTADLDRAVRLHIYRAFLERGRPPSVAATAAAVGREEEDVAAAFDRIAAGRVIVLERGTREIRMAPPLSAVPTRFTVRVDGRDYYGNCIWDALGVPAMLGRDAVITARCGDCDAPLTLEVRGGALARAEGVVHFAVPARRWWDDIVFT
jgi:hypothetical protein